MVELDYRGARASNAGDEFHELWAVRQALALLEPASELKAITVEGVLAAAHKDTASNVWDGVDCALYFGSDTVATASRIDSYAFNRKQKYFNKPQVKLPQVVG